MDSRFRVDDVVALREPSFASSDFFDAQDLLQVRYEMVRLVRLGQATLAEPGVVAEVDGFGNLLIPVAQGDERAAGDAVDSAADPVTDAITLAVVQNGLGQIASEMDLVYQKTSFSPVISEAFDRANGIYDRNDGKIISPSEYISPPSTSQRAR